MLISVTVDFARWHNFGEHARLADALREQSADLERYRLATPFLFRIRDVDLIPAGFWLPLLWMGRWALRDVQSLREVQHVDMALGGTGSYIVLIRNGDNVTAELPGPHGVRADIDYTSLLAAWEDCSDRIRHYLHEELPELAEWPDFAPWFRGEVDWWVDFAYKDERDGPGQPSE